jgi:hypothetical protein
MFHEKIVAAVAHAIHQIIHKALPNAACLSYFKSYLNFSR